MTENTKFLIALSSFPKFRSKHISKIKNFFPNFKMAFEASSEELFNAGINQEMANEFIAYRINFDINKSLDVLEKENIKIISKDEDDYPKLLGTIYDPPEILYYKGTLPKKDSRLFGIVGSRSMTLYGKLVANEIAFELARAGLTIVSGLALGIDTEAHSATLRASGTTIAVLGSGLDRAHIYPSVNRYLAEKIINEGGAVASEYPPGTEPLKYNFPERNRIIAGISEGILVIEARQSSGALITAKFALEEGRNVFAIPGPINSENSYGPNELIKTGAYPVTLPTDILSILEIKVTESKKEIKLNEVESKILSIITKYPKHVDIISRESGLDTSILMSTLTVMEMNGFIRNMGGMQYVKTI